MATSQQPESSPPATAALFSGSVIFTVLRLVALGLIDAFAIWFIGRLIGDEEYILAGFVAVVTVGLNFIFLVPGLYPYRWFAPGLALLILVLIYPTVFTIYVAFTNYRDGNLLTRSQAEDVMSGRLYLAADAPTYSWTAFRSVEPPYRYGLWLIPDSDRVGEVIFAEVGKVTPASQIDLGPYSLDDDGIPTALPGFQRLTRGEAIRIADSVLNQLNFGEEGNVIKFNPRNPTRQAGVFRQKYTFDAAGNMFDNELQVLYKPIDGTYTPVQGPYMDDRGNVATEVQPMGPLTRYTLNDDGTLLDSESDVLYDLTRDGEAVQGPFIDARGQIAVGGKVAGPLTTLTFNPDGTLTDSDGIVYEARDGVFEPIAGPLTDQDGNPAFGGQPAEPLTEIRFEDGRALHLTSGVVYAPQDGVFIAVDGPFKDAAGNVAVDGTLVGPLEGYTYAEGRLTDTATGIVYAGSGDVFVPVDGPFKDAEGRVLEAEDGDPVGALPYYRFNAETGTFLDLLSGVTYAAQDGQAVPVDGPFKDAQGRVAIGAAVVQPVTDYRFDADDNTLYHRTLGVTYALQDGTPTPIDAPFRAADGTLYVGATSVGTLMAIDQPGSQSSLVRLIWGFGEDPLVRETDPAYTLEDDGTIVSTVTGLTYQAVEGVLTPIDGPFRDTQNQIAYGAQIVAPLKEFVLNDDGTLYNTRTRVLYQRDLEGVLQPIDGPFKDADGTVLEAKVLDVVRPGYYVMTGLDNFKELIQNDKIRGPFVRVFLWTFAHAFFTVFLTFWLGLFLALVLNVKFTPGRAVLRTLLLVPYAIPAFISVLVWKGLLNEQLGVINKALVDILPIDSGPRWTSDATWVKVGILLIQLWLGFPYMMLITTGALQSIPGDIYEAARVDGANALQQFRHLTLPMLLVAVGPLLIASFAFNFNNFTIVELFAKGGPPISPDTAAGHSDILITYTYELAFGSGRGADYGFASTISIVIFAIVAVITLFNFRFTQSWEEISENV